MKKEEKIKTLRQRIEEIDKERENVEEEWAKAVKELSDKPSFDIYTKKGENQLKKLTENFTPIFFELDEERRELVEVHNSLVDELQKKSEENN